MKRRLWCRGECVKQIPVSREDCSLWSRIRRGYRDAFGTGSMSEDWPNELRINGSMWMRLPIERYQFEEVYGISQLKKGEGYLYSDINLDDTLTVSIECGKFTRGMFRSPVYVALLKLEGRTAEDRSLKQAVAGFLGSRRLSEVFRTFDLWLDGQFPPALTFDAALYFGGKS